MSDTTRSTLESTSTTPPSGSSGFSTRPSSAWTRSKSASPPWSADARPQAEPGFSATFAFPLPPKRGNRKGHSRWESGGSRRLGIPSREKYFSDSADLNAAQMLQCRRFEFALMFIRFSVPNRRWDFDNLMAALKWPVDFLKIRGIIANDSALRLWPGEVPRQDLADTGSGGLWITLRAETKGRILYACQFGGRVR